MGGLEERLDILLHRDTADVQLHRSRQSRQGRVPGNARSKMLNIDPASPRLRMAEAMDFQLCGHRFRGRSEEHTSELPSLMRISYAVFCLKKKINHTKTS